MFLSVNVHFGFLPSLMKNEQSQLLKLGWRKALFAYLCVHVCYGKHSMNYRNKHFACLTQVWGKMISSCSSEVIKMAAKQIHYKTCSGQTQTISPEAELLVFYLRSVIYFRKVKDKEKIYPFDMIKEGRGTDTQLITSRHISLEKGTRGP